MQIADEWVPGVYWEGRITSDGRVYGVLVGRANLSLQELLSTMTPPALLVDLHALEQQVAAALVAAGCDPMAWWVSETEPGQIGFLLAAIHPDMEPGFIQVAHYDWPGVDWRPHMARYAAALEAAGLRYTWDLEDAPELPRLQVPLDQGAGARKG